MTPICVAIAWEVVNAAEREELRTTPVAYKLQQLASLMASAREFGWIDTLAGEKTEVRDRKMRTEET